MTDAMKRDERFEHGKGVKNKNEEPKHNEIYTKKK